MNLETEFGIDAKKEAALVDFFRQADTRFPQDRTVLTPLIGGGYQKIFGQLNFAALEFIFREHQLNTHLLAIKTSLVEPQNPHVMVVDVNDVLKGVYTRRPYVAIAFASLDEIVVGARAHGFTYNADTNLNHLKIAGVYAPRPGSDLSQQLGKIPPDRPLPKGWFRR